MTTKTQMTIEQFEEAGIAALVRAGERKQWFAGHFGASLIAGSRLLRDPGLPAESGFALSGKLGEMRYKHRDWYSPLELVEGAPTNLTVEPLLVLLRRTAGRLRMSGHSTIYLSGALHVLARRPDLLTSRVLDGLTQLHDAGLEDDSGRYYGHSDFFEVVERQPCDSGSVPSAGVTAFRASIAELHHLRADEVIDGRRYFFAGEKIHLVTFAHAIATFEELGHCDLAAAAFRAQKGLLALVPASNELVARSLAPARTTPFEAEFWEQTPEDEAHVIKLAEAIVSLLPRLPEEERPKALERVGVLWALLGNC